MSPFTRFFEWIRAQVAKLQPFLAKLQEILDRNRYGYRCQDCGRWFTASHTCGDQGQHLHVWLWKAGPYAPRHVRIARDRAHEHAPPWRPYDPSQSPRARGTHMGRDVLDIRTGQPYVPTTPGLSAEFRQAMIDRLRQAGVVVYDSDPLPERTHDAEPDRPRGGRSASSGGEIAP